MDEQQLNYYYKIWPHLERIIDLIKAWDSYRGLLFVSSSDVDLTIASKLGGWPGLQARFLLLDKTHLSWE